MRIFSSLKSVPFFFGLVAFAACAGSNGFGIYDNPNQIAVDSVNDRLFLSQPGGELFAMVASTREPLAAQPIVSEDENAAVSALLPQTAANFAAYANGSASRLFIMGAFSDAGALITNRIRVLDFDGTSFAEATFSPIDISDGDATTDETDDSFADLVVDQGNSSVYVSDASAGLVFALSAIDGSALAAPITVAGEPQGMALDNGRLYVCNSSDVAVEQVVTVFNVAGFAATVIDLDIPCDRIAVASNVNGTAMIAKNSARQQALIRSVDTTTYAASSAIAATTSGYAAGELSSGAGISSGLNDVTLSRDASENLQGYLSEEDGNVEFVTIVPDLSSYSAQTLSVAAINLGEGGVLASGGFGEDVFFSAESGALVTVPVGSIDVDLDD
jgi:hypothetical protein